MLGKGGEIAGMLVRSHHAGLPSVGEERVNGTFRGCPAFRDRRSLQHTTVNLDLYEAAYAPAVKLGKPTRVEDWRGLTHRIALSCLVDADHTDTARHCGEMAATKPPEGRWEERLAKLDEYVKCLSARAQNKERARQRSALYEACRSAEIEPRLRSCEAAVGTGKTTAVMAFLLRAAQASGLRHVFVVLPYTNIIQQSVETYRKALVLDGENPEEVVAELHHLADFEAAGSRHLAALWQAPVIVTTAVQFFETLAGNLPARLRKLHELPGSAVFVDEAHAAIPTGLWPQTWFWLKALSEDWGCRFVLGSGSLTRFWEIPGLVETAEVVPDLAPASLRDELNANEAARIAVKRKDHTLSLGDLIDFTAGLKGPRLVILNTVQNAAVLAEHLRKLGGDVLHLSTALAPVDRERIVKRVRERLKSPEDSDWALVATSCVEAGMDFSFHSAIRESCGAASLIQIGGRVNREGQQEGSVIWDVRLQDSLLNSNPQFQRLRDVLAELFEEGWVDREPPAKLVTEAMRRELLRWWGPKGDELKRAETDLDFTGVAEKYRVVEDDTRLVVVGADLRRRLHARDKVTSRELLLGSVRVREHKIEVLKIRELPMLPEVYEWTAPYDPDFLGYMAGVLPLIQGRQTGALWG